MTMLRMLTFRPAPKAALPPLAPLKSTIPQLTSLAKEEQIPAVFQKNIWIHYQIAVYKQMRKQQKK